MERRKHPRYRFLCEILFPGKEESVAGTVTDLSMGGCKVGSPTPVDTGTYIEMRIYIMDAPEFPLKVDQAVVRWAKEQEFGVEFISMRPEEEERLRRFVSTLETRPSH